MEDEQYSEGERLAGQALMQMPKSPALHNLMGLEKRTERINVFRLMWESGIVW